MPVRSGRVLRPGGIPGRGRGGSGPIREADPMTTNEACGDDVAQIARRTGYHLRFSRVIYLGEPLACIQAKTADSSVTRCSPRHPSRAQTAGLSRHRRASSGVGGYASPPESTSTCAPPTSPPAGLMRLLQTTRSAASSWRSLHVARPTAPSSSRATSIVAPPAPLRASLDPHRRVPEQDPGRQHVYGTGALRSPSAEVVPATHTDHDILLVRARLTAQR